MKRIALICASLLMVGACTYDVQTTSGVEYLQRYEEAREETRTVDTAVDETELRIGRTNVVDEDIYLAANVEPILELPARFGLARIVNGQLTSIPAQEGEMWSALVEKYDRLGTFVPISPLIANYTTQSVQAKLAARHGRQAKGSREIVSTIRLGAARQHLDAVLIYEVGATSRGQKNPFSLADLTIVGGAFLPTRSLNARGVAQALLIDVRNGYPYGTASAEQDLSGFSTTFTSGELQRNLRDRAVLKVTQALIPEIDGMMQALILTQAMKN